MAIFRKTYKHAVYIWEVEDLWEASKDLPVKKIHIASLGSLNEIRWREDFTINNVIKHCKRILEADLSYPIILCPQGSCMDGYHRIAKTLLNQEEHVKAVQFEVLPEPSRIEVSNFK